MSKAPSKNWKILYSTKDFDDAPTKKLRETIQKFIKDRNLTKLTVSLDIYTMTDNFVVIHGMSSQDLANGVASVLKEFKEYKVPQTAILITTENYTIVQVKKNLEEYLTGDLPDTAQQPNWDGTLEKAPQQQQQQVQQEQQLQSEKNEGVQRELKQNTKGNNPPSDGDQYGPPPAPQEKSGKKG